MVREEWEPVDTVTATTRVGLLRFLPEGEPVVNAVAVWRTMVGPTFPAIICLVPGY